MNKDIIIKYIEKNKELELLEKLELLGLETYDDKYKRLIEILFVLINNTNNNFWPVQQFLFTSIYKVLGEILASKNSIDDFIVTIENSISGDCNHAPKFIGRFILNIKDNVEGMGRTDNIDVLEYELKSLNTRFLKEMISGNKSYDLLIETLYNCIGDMQEDRRIILHRTALDIFYEYLLETPQKYLSFFIRPLYTGPTKDFPEYYVYVPEPFNGQIFNDRVDDFVKAVEAKVKSDLLSDIGRFLEMSKRSKSRHNSVMLYSKDNPNYNRDHLKLRSDAHVHVRRSCAPPDYTESGYL